jgi:DNA-binding CsgD family transcriptional regulator
MLKRETGGLEQVRGLVTGEEDPAQTWVPGLLATYTELGLRAPAARALDHLMTRGLPSAISSAVWVAVLSFAVEAAVWLEDVGTCRRLLPLAREYAGLNLVAGEFLAPLGSADRFIGALESVLGLPSADDSLAAALEMDTRMGSPLHTATTLAAQVAHRYRSGRTAATASEEGVTALISRARALSDRHGLVRVSRLLDQPSASSRRKAHGSLGSGPLAGLTQREIEVLGLIGFGYSNRRIAGELVISEHTAANHVRSILMKTGARNRTEAAFLARSAGDGG